MFLIEKKKKKKISLEDPPPFGPLVTKIHLFDNEIDCLQPNGLQIIQQTINAFARLDEFRCIFSSRKSSIYSD